MLKKITGTFIDGVAADIPSNNWGAEEWALQFDEFKRMGIDTAIIIRVGFRDSAMYKSDVLKTTLYAEPDLVDVVLREGERTGIDIYMGLFDTVDYWLKNDWDSEVGINTDLIHELNERYGKRKAFKGWYMCHEGSLQTHPHRIWKPLCKVIRSFDTVRPIIVSPRYHGPKYTQNPVPPDVHAKHFDFLLGEMEGLISAYAFMDGHVHFKDLPAYVKATAEVFKKHGIAYWSNLETFDRDMPWRFPPIEWAKMRFKLETVQDYVEKIISFEVPHFLSPYSMYPSAHTLYKRYMEYVEARKG